MKFYAMDQNKLPLAGVTVIAGTQSVQTDYTGIAEVDTTTEAYCTLQKEGFFDALIPAQGSEECTITLIPATAWEDYVINDETLTHEITYSAGWQYYNAYPGDTSVDDINKNLVLYNTDAHGTKQAGETATLHFSGKNLRVFGLADSYGGNATITIDGGVPMAISFYRSRLAEATSFGIALASYNNHTNQKNTNNSKAYALLFETHDLADTEHTMVLCTGDAPHGNPDICRAILDFIDVSDRPIFNRFNFAPYHISHIGATSAYATQRVMARGKGEITQVGFVSSVRGTPTVANHVTFAELRPDGRFEAMIEGLAPYTRYRTRPFAVADGIVTYGHECESFRTEGTVTLSHEMYGGFAGEVFTLSVLPDEKQAAVEWVCETLVHPTKQVSLPATEIVALTPAPNGVQVKLLAEGNVLLKAINPITKECCAYCDITVAKREKAPLAQTPPMGWNSWNCFLRKINRDNISEIIDAMAKPITKDGKSLKDVGYNTCVIDGGWRENYLDENGGMIPSVLMGGKDGIRTLAAKAKEKGLALGLHISPGDRDCISQPMGAKWNEATHYEQFRDWGVTFLKIDQCDYRPYLHNDMFDYARWMYFRHKYFMDNSGSETVYSISNYHFDGWQHEIAHMWRVSGDIATCMNTHNPCGARWNVSGTFSSVCECANLSNEAADFAGVNAWNDAEMCVVGDPGLNEIENQSHFNLWCIMASPLVLGNDLRMMSEEVIEIITNEEAIAVDQDALGVQGRRIWKRSPAGEALEGIAPALELWAKPLADGSFAVLLLNSTEAVCDSMQFAFQEVRFDNQDTGASYALEGAAFSLRDLNAHQELGVYTDAFQTGVLQPHESVLLKVTPVN